MSEPARPMTCYRHPDRETGLSCSECGRPICTDCMTVAPVGLRCPEHSGQPQQRVARATRAVTRPRASQTATLVTKGLIAANALVFLVNLGQGASLNRNGGDLFIDWALIVRGFDGVQLVGVAEGEWWRLITAAFLHGGILHLGMNMLMLWWIGSPMEMALGRARFLGLYLVTALSGSAGALLLDPESLTVGASGAIFGILGAALVLERQRVYVLGGSALSIIVLNLVITFAVPNISIGGHVGGLAGGILCGLALTRFGRAHAVYGRPGVLGVAGLAAVAAGSVLIAYLQVQQYA
jgi:membrane associated rhomboid family serine protease